MSSEFYGWPPPQPGSFGPLWLPSCGDAAIAWIVSLRSSSSQHRHEVCSSSKCAKVILESSHLARAGAGRLLGRCRRLHVPRRIRGGTARGASLRRGGAVLGGKEDGDDVKASTNILLSAAPPSAPWTPAHHPTGSEPVARNPLTAWTSECLVGARNYI